MKSRGMKAKIQASNTVFQRWVVSACATQQLGHGSAHSLCKFRVDFSSFWTSHTVFRVTGKWSKHFHMHVFQPSSKDCLIVILILK